MSLGSSNAPYICYTFCGNANKDKGVREEGKWAVESTDRWSLGGNTNGAEPDSLCQERIHF